MFGEDIPDDFTYVPSFQSRSAPDPSDVQIAAEVLASGEEPGHLCRPGGSFCKSVGRTQTARRRLEYPGHDEFRGQECFPEDHPLSLGSGGRSIPRAVHQFLDQADVIFGIGCSFALTGFGVPMPRGKTIIHATLDPMDLNKDVPAAHTMVGDAQAYTLYVE